MAPETNNTEHTCEPHYGMYPCRRCGGRQTACFLIGHRDSCHEDFGKGEDWHMGCVCSDCGNDFDEIDGYP
jgi:hypothetical protein